MPEASIESERIQPAVAGLVAIIQAKLNGVSTSAMTAATAEMLTESAVLPRPKWVMTLLSEPPGQAATRIIAASTFGGRSSARVASQVAPGSSTNCGIRPQITARGVSATRVKSATRSSSATENTMVASTRLRISCCVVIGAGVQPAGSRRPRDSASPGRAYSTFAPEEMHHLLPLGGLGGDHLAEVLGRAGDRLAAELGQALAHLRVGQRAVDLGVDLVDELARRVLRHADAEPGGRLVAGHGLADRRQVRQRRLALLRGDRQRAQLAALDVADGRRQVVEQHVAPGRPSGRSAPGRRPCTARAACRSRSST